MPVKKTIEDGVAVLTLELGRGNAINDAFIAAVDEALTEVDVPEVRSVVITAQGRAFCGGLDLLHAYDLDSVALGRFVDAFDALFLRVFAFPRPVVAAVNGHALAGGCILALAADHRVMAPGSHVIGVNEVQLGIPFPAGALEIVRHALPARTHFEALVEGRRFSPDEALAAGFVHAIAGDAGVVADAVAKARLLGSGGSEATRDTKADLVAPALARVAATQEALRARFIARWFAPEARTRVGAVRDELLRRRSA